MILSLTAEFHLPEGNAGVIRGILDHLFKQVRCDVLAAGAGDQISAWNDSLTAIQKIIDDSINRNDELNSQLSGIDKEITDIEHFIEFGNFNAYQGWMCFKILQGMLRQRRKYKNEMEVLTTIRNFGFNQQNLSSLKTKISEQNKVYKPRKFSELFVHTS